MTTEAGEALVVATRLVRPDWPPWLRGYLALARMNYLLMVDDAPGALDAAWQQYECCSKGRIIHGQTIALTKRRHLRDGPGALRVSHRAAGRSVEPEAKARVDVGQPCADPGVSQRTRRRRARIDVWQRGVAVVAASAACDLAAGRHGGRACAARCTKPRGSLDGSCTGSARAGRSSRAACHSARYNGCA